MNVFTGTIRSIEVITVEAEGASLAEVKAKLHEQTPPGFDLTDAPVTMRAGEGTLTAIGRFARRDGTRDIEADDIPSLRAKVPEGWQLLNVR